jgi:hypothetical protein
MALPITLVNMCSREEGTRDERPWQHPYRDLPRSQQVLGGDDKEIIPLATRSSAGLPLPANSGSLSVPLRSGKWSYVVLSSVLVAVVESCIVSGVTQNPEGPELLQ